MYKGTFFMVFPISVQKMVFLVCLVLRNTCESKFLCYPIKFSMWNQVFLVKLNSLDVNFFENVVELKYVLTKSNH